jgi:hypothetical protein
VPSELNAFVYVYKGKGQVGSDRQAVNEGQAAVAGKEGNAIDLHTTVRRIVHADAGVGKSEHWMAGWLGSDGCVNGSDLLCGCLVGYTDRTMRCAAFFWRACQSTSQSVRI